MPIRLDWYDDKQTVLIYRFDGIWTWEEFNTIDEPIWDLVAQSHYRIDLLLDWTKSAGFPIGIVSSIHRAGGNKTTIIEEGLTISVGGSYLIKILHGTFRRLYPKAAAAYRAVDSLEDAIRLLEAERGTSIQESISAFK